MSNYIATEGQTAYDIALQAYGTVEQVGRLLPFVASLTDEIAAGAGFDLPAATPNAINEFFKGRRPIATRKGRMGGQ